MAERRAAYLGRLRCRFAEWELSRLDEATALLEELAALLATEPPDPLPLHASSTHDSEDHA